MPIVNEAREVCVFSNGMEGRQMTFRQGTAWDFVGCAGAGEVVAGAASVWAEQETFKV